MTAAKVDEEAATNLATDFAAIAVNVGIFEPETLRACMKLSAAMLGAEPCDICRKARFEEVMAILYREMEAAAKESPLQGLDLVCERCNA